MAEEKHIEIIVLDTGPIIQNEPTISSLISQAKRLVTIPAVLSEIKDAETRSRFDTTWRPFLDLREPMPASVKVITDFARRTGDLAVLSRPDILVLALAYELECELNGSDWRLRRLPGQKNLNGPDPAAQKTSSAASTPIAVAVEQERPLKGSEIIVQDHEDLKVDVSEAQSSNMTSKEIQAIEEVVETLRVTDSSEPDSMSQGADSPKDFEDDRQDAEKNDQTSATVESGLLENSPNDLEVADSGSDSEGWITPSNIKRHQEKNDSKATKLEIQPSILKVATLTSDFAMQNVLLQMNLHLISPSFRRIRHLKTQILRCHACFMNVKDMSKQFCPRCGKPTLTRVTCTTNERGQFQLHLKKNMQWNTRGDRYSIPKLVPGSANGKVNVGGGGKGGGKGGWGQALILAEDQKEYVRTLEERKREKQKNLMDEDYLPSILTGDRNKSGGRPKIGAGRTVNSRKR